MIDHRCGSTSTKPVPKGDNDPHQPSTSSTFEITGDEPVFLRRTTDLQAINLAVTFPVEVKLDKIDDGLASQSEPTSSDKEIFPRVKFAAETSSTIFFRVTSSKGNASVCALDKDYSHPVLFIFR